MKEDALLKKAQAIREEEHRLRPSLRLKTFEEIVEFVHSKGLVSTLGGNELPSLISAILGKPWKPSGKGFTSWLEWWNFRVSNRPVSKVLGELPGRPDILGTRIFRNTKTLVSKTIWPLLDPIVSRDSKLAEEHEIVSELEWNIFHTISEKGPIRTDKLRALLKIEGKENTAKFHRALARLENHAIIVGYEDPKPEKHLHASIWQLWSQRVVSSKLTKSSLSYRNALVELLGKTVDAAVFLPEKEVGRLFPWDGEMEAVKDELVANGTTLRAGPFLVAARVSQ